MIADVRARFPDSLDLVFLDDWQVYHMGLGEDSLRLKRQADCTTHVVGRDAGHLIPRGG